MSVKVLMFGDTAFVGSTIANYWRDHGYQFRIYEMNLNNRKVWFADMPSTKLVDDIIEVDQSWVPDIIHINFYTKAVPILAKMFPRAKIIMSLHGSELRNGGWGPVLNKTKEFVSTYTLSTMDLLLVPNRPDNSLLMLNAPDMALIENHKCVSPIYDRHLQVLMKHFRNEASEYCPDIADIRKAFFQRRGYGEIYPRKTYFHFLSHFSHFHDHRIVDGEHLGLSLTAIEFLAMGGYVHHNGEWLTTLPQTHDYKRIMNLWNELYQILLDQ